MQQIQIQHHLPEMAVNFSLHVSHDNASVYIQAAEFDDQNNKFQLTSENQL